LTTKWLKRHNYIQIRSCRFLHWSERESSLPFAFYAAFF